MNNSIPDISSNQRKVLQLLAQAFAAGLSEAARNELQKKASVSCVGIERTSLRTLLQPAPAILGLEIRFDAGINGAALLAVPKPDLARIAGVLAGLECDEHTALAPEFMESTLQLFAHGVDASCRSFAQSCGLPIHASAPRVVNPEGDDAALLQSVESYSDVACLTFRVKLENLPDDHILLLAHSDLLASLNAQLPHYADPGAPAAIPNDAANRREGAGRSPKPKWNMDLILDVELEVAVSFGEAQMPLRDVLKLGVGSVIELEKGVNDPVTILVNDKPIVSGEVVVVNGNYGVKVLEVESTAERIRSMGR